MSTIQIRPTELRSRANELENLRQTHLEIMKQLRILVMSLPDVWKGEAEEAFVSSYLSQNQTMTDLANTLEDYIQLAQKAADEIETKDQSLLAQVRSKLS